MSTPETKALGARIRSERNKRGLSTSELATIIGVCRVTINKAERGDPGGYNTREGFERMQNRILNGVLAPLSINPQTDPPGLDMTGEEIKLYRKSFGWTQNEMVKRTSVKTFSYLSWVEKGQWRYSRKRFNEVQKEFCTLLLDEWNIRYGANDAIEQQKEDQGVKDTGELVKANPTTSTGKTLELLAKKRDEQGTGILIERREILDKLAEVKQAIQSIHVESQEKRSRVAELEKELGSITVLKPSLLLKEKREAKRQLIDLRNELEICEAPLPALETAEQRIHEELQGVELEIQQRAMKRALQKISGLAKTVDSYMEELKRGIEIVEKTVRDITPVNSRGGSK